MNKILLSAICAVVLQTTAVSAQSLSSGCAAVNALGSQSLTLGTPVTFGPFSGFDEGYANQPSDGDTIRLGIGARDMQVSVEYIGSGGTSSDTMTPSNTFSNLIIGGSSNHPEDGSLSIRLTMTGGTSSRPSVYIQCLGTPNPGQPSDPSDPTDPTDPVDPPDPDPVISEDEITLIGGDFAGALAELDAKLGTSPSDLPSKLTTPSPSASLTTSEQMDELADDVISAGEDALRITRLDLEADLEEIVDSFGLSESDAAELVEILGDGFIRWLGEVELNSSRGVDTVEDSEFSRFHVRVVQELFGVRSQDIRPTNTDGARQGEIRRRGREFGLSYDQIERLQTQIKNEILRLHRSPEGRLARVLLQVRESTYEDSTSRQAEELGRSLDALQQMADDQELSINVGAFQTQLNTIMDNTDLELVEGEEVTRLNSVDSNGLSFTLSTKGIDGALGGGTNLWMQGRLSLLSGNGAGTDGTAFNLRFGVIHKLSDRAELGAFLGGFRSDHTLNSTGAEITTEAYRVGIYGNMRLGQGLTLGASLHKENGETRNVNGTVSGQYGYDILGASVSLTGQTKWENWVLAPSLTYDWSHRETDAYVNSASVSVRETELTTNALTAAVLATRSRKLKGSRLRQIDTRLRMAATYFDRDHSVLSAANQNRAGGSLGAGVTLHFKRGGTLSLDASAGGLGQDTQTFGLSGRYSLDF